MIIAKRVLEAAKFAYNIKTKEFITSQKLDCATFRELLIMFSTKVNLCLLYVISDEAKLFAQNFSKNSNLSNSVISLAYFSF